MWWGHLECQIMQVLVKAFQWFWTLFQGQKENIIKKVLIGELVI